MKLSEKDRELLSALGENARVPVATLAKKLGLSRTTIQARLERLEREGVIAAIPFDYPRNTPRVWSKRISLSQLPRNLSLRSAARSRR